MEKRKIQDYLGFAKEIELLDLKWLKYQRKRKNKKVTLQLDRYVKNWFEEKDVNYQKKK